MTRLVPNLTRKLAQKWLSTADGYRYARRFEKMKKFRKNVPISVSFDGEMFLVAEGREELAVARKSRLHFHIRGIEARRNTLKKEYLIPDNFFHPGDTVVDCGANIGEFALICAAEGANVFAFEPDKIDFAALERNSREKSIYPIQRALWNETKSLTFYDSNDEGDSSLIRPARSTSNYQVKAQKLDDTPELPDGPIRLVKLEAEGAEPEILQGMEKTLCRVQYITVDMGPERGASKDNTVSECTSTLYDSGFRMISFFPPRCTALFERAG